MGDPSRRSVATGDALMAAVRVLYDAQVRWQQGREKFGEEWVGREPLVEAYEELLDAINYFREHQRRHGSAPWLDKAMADLIGVAMAVKVNGPE